MDMFLESKIDSFSAFKKLAKRLQNMSCNNICAIRSDHGGEFQNENSVLFVKNLEIFITFMLLELPNKMGLWKGRTNLLRNLLEPFKVSSLCQNIFGMMPLAHFAM